VRLKRKYITGLDVISRVTDFPDCVRFSQMAHTKCPCSEDVQTLVERGARHDFVGQHSRSNVQPLTNPCQYFAYWDVNEQLPQRWTGLTAQE
jgi:hypothetical protein